MDWLGGFYEGNREGVDEHSLDQLVFVNAWGKETWGLGEFQGFGAKILNGRTFLRSLEMLPLVVHLGEFGG